MPICNKFSPYVDNDRICFVIRSMIDLQSCEWAIGRARKTDTNIYQKRLETQKKKSESQR